MHVHLFVLYVTTNSYRKNLKYSELHQLSACIICPSAMHTTTHCRTTCTICTIYDHQLQAWEQQEKNKQTETFWLGHNQQPTVNFSKPFYSTPDVPGKNDQRHPLCDIARNLLPRTNQELKAEGKADEEIYIELKNLYNISAAPTSADGSTDTEKRASHASAAAAAAAADAVSSAAPGEAVAAAAAEGAAALATVET